MDISQAELLRAVATDDLRGIDKALAAGADINARCDDGASVLYLACIRGNVEVVRALLELGADANLRADLPAADMYAETPLGLVKGAQFLLDWEKYTPIYDLLVERGAVDQGRRVPVSADNDARRRWHALTWQAKGRHPRLSYATSRRFASVGYRLAASYNILLRRPTR
ncbi:MAG TPA: ankyrin repeat domain-containing protein [Gaiellaceae bacterium]|jgi:hypothetical protein|nr:ankyrin repeat domain-containing protein [Gaiellaceae bacterium]